MSVNENNLYLIRPAGRLLLTIGRELIQDPCAAILELVKNAYDADSPDVVLSFHASGVDGITITVEDHGHGMSRETVLDAWLVPSTSDKQNRRESPKGRIMQGCKGVGRFAASMLGEFLEMETVTEAGEQTRVMMDWKIFENATFLDEVHVPVVTNPTKKKSGTKMIMTGVGEYRSVWSQDQFGKLMKELKKLVAPSASISTELHRSKDDFSIILQIEGFGEKIDQQRTKVEPFPVFDLYDYRICGTVKANGQGELTYHQNRLVGDSKSSPIRFDFGHPTGCGCVDLDIRVYDRETEAIDALIERGLKKEVGIGSRIGRLEAKRILDAFCGIGVYRNGFRIRPLGDASFDWLQLNFLRVQNPSLNIGSNQAIGFVRIESEEKSGLIEKSARDGLKDNEAYLSLKSLTLKVITELQQRRYISRKKARMSRPVVRVEDKLEKFSSLDNVRKTVKKSLAEHGVAREAIDAVELVMDQEQVKMSRQADAILKEIAIYQAHAALGKLMQYVIHEAKLPLSFFQNSVDLLMKFFQLYLNTKQKEIIEEDILPLVERFPEQGKKLTNLFSKLTPLANGSTQNRVSFSIKKELQRIISVFSPTTGKEGISLVVNGDENIELYGWKQDFDSIFSSLLDNSMFWMCEKSSSIREIRIEIVADESGKLRYVDYIDSGPGIEASLLDSGVIFDPGFSKKADGFGLGLAIAGEASRRLGLSLQALAHDGGAWFRLTLGSNDTQQIS